MHGIVGSNHSPAKYEFRIILNSEYGDPSTSPGDSLLTDIGGLLSFCNSTLISNTFSCNCTAVA